MSGSAQVVRYVINGLAATAVHFGLLYLNLKVLGVPSAGLANLMAAAGGITASFLGSRYFVFRASGQPWLAQAGRFGVLYALIAGLHGAVLFAWTDLAGQDYRLGFLIATALQMLCSYVGNQRLVFRQPAPPQASGIKP